MEIKSTRPAVKGPGEMFTGEAWVETVHVGEDPSRVRFNKVRFSPGAHTAWHSHILGQTLFVIDGIGRV
ncbi:MAG: cupin domain-containing protein, partial [Acidimicrobiales bacterium]